MFYVYKNNQQWGPYSVEELNGYISAGNFSWDDLVCEEEQADWVPARQMLGDSAVQNVLSSENVESDHTAKTESHDSQVICPDRACLKRNNPKDCEGCGFWIDLVKSQGNRGVEDSEYGELPAHTFPSDRFVIKDLIRTKFPDQEKYMTMGRIIGISLPLFFIAVAVWIGNAETARDTVVKIIESFSFGSEIAVSVISLSLLSSIYILSVHHIQFGLVIYWSLANAFRKEYIWITIKLVCLFVIHAVLAAAILTCFGIYAPKLLPICIVIAVPFTVSVAMYPYFILCGKPFPDGIYLEYWHGTDKLGWENYQKDLYTKRIWKDGK